MLLKATNVLPWCGPNVGSGMTVMPSLGHDRAANRPECITIEANTISIPLKQHKGTPTNKTTLKA